jgi:hypothetical protein
MRDMEFVGISEDGSSLVLRAPWDEEFRLVIDERLSTAARTDRTRVNQLDLGLEAALRPAEIQARLRAGASAEDIAEDAGVPVDRIRRYELPILAERAYVAELARDTVVRRENDETLESLVIRRLLERGESADELSWDSFRREDARWQIVVTGSTVSAAFAFEPSGRTIVAADDTGRTLLNTETPRLVPVEERDDVDELIDWVSDTSQTRRNDTVPVNRRPMAVVREPEVENVIEIDHEELFDNYEDDELIIDDEELPPVVAPPAPAAHKKGRASVPSWDEILFGTKPND